MRAPHLVALQEGGVLLLVGVMTEGAGPGPSPLDRVDGPVALITVPADG